MNLDDKLAIQTRNVSLTCMTCFSYFDQDKYQFIVICQKQHRLCKVCFSLLIQEYWQKCPCCLKIIDLQQVIMKNHLHQSITCLVSTRIEEIASFNQKLITKIINYHCQQLQQINHLQIIQYMKTKQLLKIQQILNNHFITKNCFTKEQILGDLKFICHDIYGGLRHYLQLIQHCLNDNINFGINKIGINDQWKNYKNRSFLRGYLQEKYINGQLLSFLDICCLAFQGQKIKIESIHEFFSRLMLITPTNYDIRQCYANILFNKQQYNLALCQYEQLIAHNPMIFRYYNYKLYALVKLQSKDNLIQSLVNTIKNKFFQQSQKNQLFNFIYICYYGIDCQKELIAVQSKARNLQTVISIKYMQIIAENHFRLKNIQISKSIYLQLVKYHQSSALNSYRLACILYIQRDIESTLYYIKKSMFSNILMINNYNLLGLSYLCIKKYKEASNIFKLFIQKFPKRLDIVKKYLYCLCKSNQANQALLVVQKLSKSFTQSSFIIQIQLYLGIMYFQLQDYYTSIKYLQKFIKKYPNIFVGYKYIIRCYRKMNIETNCWQVLMQKNKVQQQSKAQCIFFNNQFKIDLKNLFYQQFKSDNI